MRRIVIWLASTVTILVLIFGYHTSTNRTASVGVPSATAPVTPGGATSGAPSGAPSGGASSPSGASPTPSATSSGSAVRKSYTGAEAQTQWGIVQVRITVTAGKITAVDVPEYPNENPRDAQINAYALPTLVQETLTAQNAEIDMVSGATVTSGGYLQSLQSALDQAGLS